MRHLFHHILYTTHKAIPKKQSPKSRAAYFQALQTWLTLILFQNQKIPAGNKLKLNTKIEDIRAEVKDNILIISSKTPLKILSSAILNGGLQEANGIINVQVPEGCGSDKSDVHWSPEKFLNEEAQRLQLPENKVVGLMTAAKMQNIAVFSEKCGKTVLTVFVRLAQLWLLRQVNLQLH